MSELMSCFFFQPTKQGAAHRRGLSPLPANSTAKQLFHPPFLYVMCRDFAGRPAPNGPLCQAFALSCIAPGASENRKACPPLPAVLQSHPAAACGEDAGPRALRGARAAGERGGSIAGAVVVHLGTILLTSLF